MRPLDQTWLGERRRIVAGQHARRSRIKIVAQFIAVCRSVTTSRTCENLPSVAAPVSQHQEMLSHADTLPFAPPLQRRTVPSLHSYTPVERPSTAMSSMPERSHWPLGHVPVSTMLQTLLVSWLQAHLQRPHRDSAPPEPAVTVALDSRNLFALPCLLVTAHCQGSGRPRPDELSLVLVAAQCGPVLRDAAPGGGH